MKFLKVGRVAIITRGGYAGKKVVSIQPQDSGTKSHPYPHALVAGIERCPQQITRRMSKTRQTIHQGHQLQPLDANKIHTRVGGIEGCCYCGYFQGGFSTGGREEDCEEGFGGEIHVWKEQMVLHSS